MKTTLAIISDIEQSHCAIATIKATGLPAWIPRSIGLLRLTAQERLF